MSKAFEDALTAGVEKRLAERRSEAAESDQKSRQLAADRQRSNELLQNVVRPVVRATQERLKSLSPEVRFVDSDIHGSMDGIVLQVQIAAGSSVDLQFETAPDGTMVFRAGTVSDHRKFLGLADADGRIARTEEDAEDCLLSALRAMRII